MHLGNLNLQPPITSQPDDAGFLEPNILNRERREQRPNIYLRTPFMKLPPTTVLPKKRGDRAKNKVKDANLSPLNLGNAFCFRQWKDIQQDIMADNKVNISYQQAWRGKDYGIEQIRGSPYESFEMLPYYCHNLERKNPGTVTRIKTDEEGVFEMLFIAIGASIRTFINYLRPLLIIDAAHLKGTYKGTNLVAVGMDVNNQIVSIAFGICKGETDPCWSWWISVPKECIADNRNLLFIFDRHHAIAIAVRNEFPLAFHVVCCCYLMMNISLEKKKTKGLFLKICKAYTHEDFATNMSILQAVQPDAYHKLCEAGVQRWSRAHCPLVRYNYMTSNSVESVNACSVINRKLPVLKLAETYRAMVQDWYYKRRQLAPNMTYEITDWAAHKVTKKRLKSASWVVKGVNNYQYQVSDGLYTREVNLQTGICECHWYKKPKYQGTYSESIHFLENMQQWEFPENIQKVIPLRMDNPQPGRPKNTNRIKSQGEEPRIICCSRCNGAGHGRDNCTKQFVVEPPGNIRRQHEQEIPRNKALAFYNPQQQYDNTYQSYNHFTSQQYGETTYPSQHYEQHDTYTSQAYDGHHMGSAQMYEQNDSQQYESQHLDDLKTNGSDNWFNSFRF
ncbi:transposase, MuDR, MULE transposase domain protein [Tanacetum coccineum]